MTTNFQSLIQRKGGRISPYSLAGCFVPQITFKSYAAIHAIKESQIKRIKKGGKQKMDAFVRFPKIARLSRDCVITEKIDGSNGQFTVKDGKITSIGSRTRFISPQSDNYGFATWVTLHEEELIVLGDGTHFGEWWGLGIQRAYGQKEKRFSLFDVGRWNSFNIPSCVSVVPTLYLGIFDTNIIQAVLEELKEKGSIASPGFMHPEGIVVYHTASKQLYKKTIENDEKPKRRQAHE